jgi:protein arginine kinase activator
MICQSCGKRQAVTHIQTNHNGVVSEYNLCAECAQKLTGSPVESYNPFLNLNSLLGSFFGRESREESVDRCPVCGASFRDISQSGKVGCAECYHKFREQLLPSIQRMHGNTHHAGKIPTGMGIQVMPENNLTVTKEPPVTETPAQRTCRELQEKLQKAIAEQDFEQAAVLRDQIKALKGEEG